MGALGLLLAAVAPLLATLGVLLAALRAILVVLGALWATLRRSVADFGNSCPHSGRRFVSGEASVSILIVFFRHQARRKRHHRLEASDALGTLGLWSLEA